jgi:hypothetical protein
MKTMNPRGSLRPGASPMRTAPNASMEAAQRALTFQRMSRTIGRVLGAAANARASPAGDERTSPQLDGFLEITAPDRCKRWLDGS